MAQKNTSAEARPAGPEMAGDRPEQDAPAGAPAAPRARGRFDARMTGVMAGPHHFSSSRDWKEYRAGYAEGAETEKGRMKAEEQSSAPASLETGDPHAGLRCQVCDGIQEAHGRRMFAAGHQNQWGRFIPCPGFSGDDEDAREVLKRKQAFSDAMRLTAEEAAAWNEKAGYSDGIHGCAEWDGMTAEPAYADAAISECWMKASSTKPERSIWPQSWKRPGHLRRRPHMALAWKSG